MRVDSTLKHYRVGDIILILPEDVDRHSDEWKDIRNKYYKDGFYLDDRVGVGVVRGVARNKIDADVYLVVSTIDGDQRYILPNQVVPMKMLNSD